MARKRSESSKRDGRGKKLSDEDWAKLERQATRLSPRSGIAILQEQGGRGVDRAARTELKPRKSKPRQA